MIQVGDKVNRKIRVYDASRGPLPVETVTPGTVIYIHPEHRFYVIEVEMPAGRHFRETMYFYPRCGMERV